MLSNEKEAKSTMIILNLLIEMDNLFSDPSKWIKGNRAKDKNDQWITPISEGACKWCLSGAKERVLWDKLIPSKLITTVDVSLNSALQRQIDFLFPFELQTDRNVISFNDSHRTKFRHIKKVLEAAIKYEREKLAKHGAAFRYKEKKNNAY